MKLSDLRKRDGIRHYGNIPPIGLGYRTKPPTGTSKRRTLFVTLPEKTWQELGLNEGEAIDLDWNPMDNRLEVTRTKNSYGVVVKHWKGYTRNLTGQCAMPSDFSIPEVNTVTWVSGEINSGNKLVIYFS